MIWVKAKSLTNMSAEFDIRACSITEYAFLQSICTGSFNALKSYKMSMFSNLS